MVPTHEAGAGDGNLETQTWEETTESEASACGTCPGGSGQAAGQQNQRSGGRRCAGPWGHLAPRHTHWAQAHLSFPSAGHDPPFHTSHRSQGPQYPHLCLGMGVPLLRAIPQPPPGPSTPLPSHFLFLLEVPGGWGWCSGCPVPPLQPSGWFSGHTGVAQVQGCFSPD